jgi:hypothetical protein
MTDSIAPINTMQIEQDRLEEFRESVKSSRSSRRPTHQLMVQFYLGRLITAPSEIHGPTNRGRTSWGKGAPYPILKEA